MDRRHARTVVSRLLHQSILELCKASVPQEQSVEIDGIVCISIGDDEDQIVVKVHEQIGTLRSVSHVSSSQNNDSCRNGGAARRLTDRMSEYQRKRQNLHSIASAASAKRLRMVESENKVESSSINSDSLKALLKGDIQLLPTIKTEMPSDDEPTDSESSYSQPGRSRKQTPSRTQTKYLDNSLSLNKLVFQDLECEHCKLLLPTFEELQAHNDQEHGTHTCSYCWRTFHSPSNYQQHLKSHRRMRIGSSSKHSNKEIAIKWKKCGMCSEVFRSVSYIMDHLSAAHEFEKCFTCTICDEYFPNRQTFVAHRKKSHMDIQQCRCETCEISLTFAEYKHHEKECLDTETADKTLQDQTEPGHHEVVQEAVDDEQPDATDDNKKEKKEKGSHCAKASHFKADSVIGQMIKSTEDAEESMTLMGMKTKKSNCNEVIIDYSQKSSEDESSSSTQSSHLSHQIQEKLQTNQDRSNEEDPIEDDEDGDDEDGNNSDNDGSEGSLGDGSDFFSMLAMPDIHALLRATRESGDRTYSHTNTPDKTVPHACQGPYRCQTCFFVIEDFEDFERHCFEMHCRYVCTYCAQTFANRRNLQRHIRRHVGDMPYVCDECGQRFYRDDNLRRHKLKHMTSVRFVCSYCSTPYENKNKLTSHLIGGHAIDVLKVTDQEIMKHVILKDDPMPNYKTVSAEQSPE